MCRNIYVRQSTCFLLLFFSLAQLFAQGHVDYESAENLYRSKSYDDCHVKLVEILSKHTSYHDSTLAATHKLIGDLHLKKYELKKTVAQYEIADSLYLTLGNRYAPKRLNVVNKIGICYAQQDNLIMTAQYFQNAYDIASSLYEPTDLNMAKAINNLATVYLYIGDFDQSLEYFEKSASIKEPFKHEDPVPLANTYENMASIYGQINQMGEAESYLNKAGQLYKMKHEDNDKALLGFYINMAGYYLEDDRIDDALEQLRLGASLPEQYQTDKLNVLLVNKNFGVAHLEKEEYAKALQYFEKAELQINQYTVGQKDLAIIYTHMARIYAKQNKISSAAEIMEKARSFMLSLYTKTHKNYLTLLQQQFSIYLEMGELESAKSIMKEYDINLAQRNRLHENDLMFSNLRMGYFAMHLNYFAKLFESYQQQDILDKGIEMAERTFAFQDKVLSSISDKESKLDFFKNAYSNFSTSIYLYLEKHKSTGESSFLEKAFQISEKAKFYSLKEARGVRLPNLEAEVPKDLFSQEKQSNIELGQAISKYENLLDQESEPEDMLSLINAIDSIKLVRSSLIEEMSALSPQLNKYLDIGPLLDVQTAQDYLSRVDKTYVSYFLSGNELIDKNFAFTLDSKGLTYIELSIEQDLLDSHIKELLKALKIDLNSNIDEEIFSAFEEPAAKLYSALISGLDYQMGEGLIFSLHNNLHAIPFEVLKKTTEDTYLIQYTTISYAPSINSLVDQSEYSYSKNLLVSSPVFKPSNILGLSALDNNMLEVKEVSELVGNNDISKANSKQEFIDYIENEEYNIIHLATHAAANQKRGYQSYLAFGNDSTQLLYSREIYGLPIQANLVVLSACESGDGELVESQGVLGLSTAFAATNTKSMLTSLWNVNDASTHKLMTAYYAHLNDGENKDEALRNSKLEYLSSVPKSKQHPYYWASFIQMGSIAPLQFEKSVGLSTFGGSIFVGFILLLFLGYFMVYIKKKAASN